MKLSLCMCSLLLGTLPVLAEDVYVPPKIFDGVLTVSTEDSLSPQQRELLQAEFEGQAGTQLIILGEVSDEQSVDSLTALKQLKWTNEPRALSMESAEEIVTAIEPLAKGDCVWLASNSLPANAALNEKLGAALRKCLDNGSLVYLQLEPLPTDQDSVVPLHLLPEMDILRAGKSAEKSADLTLKTMLRVSDHTWLRISGRAIINLSSAESNCEVRWPATSHYPSVKSQRIPPRSVADLVTFRRAWHERQVPEFPANNDYQPQLNKGSLVIVGGGRQPAEIWQKFIDLAGGKQSCIIVLPTAVPDPTLEDADERHIFTRLGAGKVTVLPQVNRDAVSSAEFLEQLRTATGVWFGGGRQWRFVDAYWGTPAWQELKQVVQRGGVVGGSSAGATIQGDLLVRGHPLGNQIMIADGYRHGLGLLPGVAIDQHFRQRNRFQDLAGVVERFPKITGIGIDEGTALIVEAPAKCQVLGEGSVWITTPDQREYVEHPSGAEFELR